ncbi:hypothetical protein [Cellulomonas olei]|uniref:hypothetical protein n=1 Tax=Cellulomonas sp. P4 TaxID=3142533 RepID=UPI0031BB069C
MSVWEDLDVEAAILEALGAVPINNPDGHHFGRPFMTAYQLALAVDANHPEIAQTLGVSVGGRGAGARNSLAQYLARELSHRIHRSPERFPVQGAFISNVHLTALVYESSDDQSVTSSLTGTGYDLSMFRLRPE